MKKIEHDWQHEMFEIYGAAMEELLRELRTEVATSVFHTLTKRVDDLKVKYEKGQLEVDSGIVSYAFEEKENRGYKENA
ncbi:hypothetical protein LCGC14_2603700 [marine sediment metagenome]|uniref:Uncharacterized protein n=1 Tax=marine sediment metagenome TaxID=412755 RepID=A0A0F9CIY4_9ZZZZ